MILDKLVILSLGLMGGSLAAAVKKRGLAKEVVGWGYRSQSLKTAIDMGIIDTYELNLEKAVKGASVVVVCSPTKVAEQLLCEVARIASPTTVITDVASVKTNLAKALEKDFTQVPANIVLAHPIAGSEVSGVKAANADLFVNHNIIITPTEKTAPSALKTVADLWRSVDAEVVKMSISEHDKVLAGTSHLPHMLAFNMVGALSKLPTSLDVYKYAAGGFRDFTRIAASDPQMWTEIAVTNKTAILDMLSLYKQELDDLSTEIEADDETALISRFASAKASRDYFSTLLQKRQKNGD